MIPQIEQLIPIAQAAGEIILQFYQQQNFTQELKKDNSPVTSADKTADTYIREELTKLFPHIPIISEEHPLPEYKERQQWSDFFLVDPLDGTKEFLLRNGEFTVNIAYFSPLLRVAVIYQPTQELLYYADGKSSYKRSGQELRQLRRKFFLAENIAVVSRSHINEATRKYIDTIPCSRVLRVGSSLKFCYLAQGDASWYPRLGPIKEWDIAAGVIILEQAGGEVKHLDGRQIEFNKNNMLVDHFVASARSN